MGPNARAALERARRRLDRLRLYPQPVGTGHVRVLTLPFLFRLPGMSRYDGYALPGTILLRDRPGEGTADDNLICHELCHVWQMQHRPLAMPLSYLRHGYRRNRYEQEARHAVAATARPA